MVTNIALAVLIYKFNIFFVNVNYDNFKISYDWLKKLTWIYKGSKLVHSFIMA